MRSGFGHSGEPRLNENDNNFESIGSIDLTGDGLVGLGGSRGVGVACLWPRMAVESAIRELSEWLRCKAYFFLLGIWGGLQLGFVRRIMEVAKVRLARGATAARRAAMMAERCKNMATAIGVVERRGSML